MIYIMEKKKDPPLKIKKNKNDHDKYIWTIMTNEKINDNTDCVYSRGLMKKYWKIKIFIE